MKTTYHLTEDLTAFMECDGAEYTGTLVIRSEILDDYDLHRLDENGEWECFHDSLSNKTEECWSDEADFHAWLESVKTLVRHAA
jgi:hypothetical protein